MTENNNPNLNILMAAIEKEVYSQIEKSYLEAKEKFIKQLDIDKAQALAGISLYIMKQVNMRQTGQEIIITIREEKK